MLYELVTKNMIVSMSYQNNVIINFIKIAVIETMTP